MGPLVWKAMVTGGALVATAIASKLVSTAWEAATGKTAPIDPANPDDATWREALVFAALSGLVIGAVRVAATRKAVEYYQASTGHLPKAMQRD